MIAHFLLALALVGPTDADRGKCDFQVARYTMRFDRSAAGEEPADFDSGCNL